MGFFFSFSYFVCVSCVSIFSFGRLLVGSSMSLSLVIRSILRSLFSHMVAGRWSLVTFYEILQRAAHIPHSKRDFPHRSRLSDFVRAGLPSPAAKYQPKRSSELVVQPIKQHKICLKLFYEIVSFFFVIFPMKIRLLQKERKLIEANIQCSHAGEWAGHLIDDHFVHLSSHVQ